MQKKFYQSLCLTLLIYSSIQAQDQTNPKGITITTNMTASSSGKITNNGIIKFSGSEAMVANGLNSNALNEGSILNGGTEGMLAWDGGTITNGKNGTIRNQDSQGMKASHGTDSHATNKGLIINASEIGMVADKNSYVTNAQGGRIQNHGDIGMEALNGGKATNEVGGTISNQGSQGMFADGTDSHATNEGLIENTKDIGMEALSGGEATNEVGGIIYNQGSQGMVANGNNSSVINNGEIANIGKSGMYANGSGSKAINNGTILNTEIYGMKAILGGTVINEIGGTISNLKTDGIYIFDPRSTGINRGTISNIGKSGMTAKNGGVIINEIGGTVSNKDDVGMYVEAGARGMNQGDISNQGSYGMYAKNSEIINGKSGRIFNNGARGMTAKGDKSTAKNSGKIKNSGDIGMEALNEGDATNELGGTISNKGSQGMLANGNNSTATNLGTISNIGDKGMVASGVGSIVKNQGTILNTGEYALFAENGGKVSHDSQGTIANGGHFGIGASGVATNGSKSTGNNNGDLDRGMKAINEGIITNLGTVTRTSNTGMVAEGSGSTAINLGTISNTGDKGMTASGVGSIVKNQGIISNTGEYALFAQNGGKVSYDGSGAISNGGSYGLGSENAGIATIELGASLNKGIKAINGGIIVNSGTITSASGTGMVAEGSGSTAINKGTISNTGDKKMTASNRGSLINAEKGVINNITNGKTGIFLSDSQQSGNLGTIEVTNGIGVKANKSNFYNSGTINALDQTAIEMDNSDSILELGAGTILRGTTDGLGGEDTLVLSGDGTIDVGNNSVHNFQKLVVTGNVTAQGVYNLGVSDGSGYQNSAFGSQNVYDLNDVSGASGNLIVDGTINIAVDYDGITSAGTDKTGKIIANTISKTKNGHIILVNGNNNKLNIIEQAVTNEKNINDFRIKNIATVSGAQAIDPTLFETNGDTKAINGWKTMTVGDRGIANGSILLGQRYYRSASTIQTPALKPIQIIKVPPMGLVPQKIPTLQTGAVIPQKTPALKPIQIIKVPPMGLVPQKIPTLQPSSKVTRSSLRNSKLIVPRNKVDLDSMNRLTKITNNLTSLDFQPLKVGEDKFTVNYLGAKGNSDFKGSKPNNYDYKTTSNGVAIAYMYQLTPNFSIGSGLSYEDTDVKYDGITLNNHIKIKAPTEHHKENIKTYNTQIFGKYQINNFNLNIGMGYGISNHDLSTNFVSGMKDGNYNSEVLKTGLEGSYNYKLINNYELIPSLGVDYIHVSEDGYKYDNSAVNLESSSSSGYISTLGLKLRKKVNKFKWSIGGGYKYSSTASFHDTRKVSGFPLEVEKLHSDKGLIFLGGNIQYDVNSDFAITSGYEHEVNKNYNNDNMNIGFTYKFNSVKDFIPNIPQNFIVKTDQINKIENKQTMRSNPVKKEKVVTFTNKDNMEFKINDYKLTKKSSKKVQEIVNKLEKKSGILIIEGHTDNTGPRKYNQKLSKKRAKNVKKALEKELKNKNLELISKGVGEDSPIYPNTTKENREKNRSVKFIIKTKK